MNFVWTLLFLFSSEVASDNYCYWNSGCPYKYFSSKTPYDTVRGDIRDSIIKLKGELVTKYLNLFITAV